MQLLNPHELALVHILEAVGAISISHLKTIYYFISPVFYILLPLIIPHIVPHVPGINIKVQQCPLKYRVCL
jgi:hypothetical protein